MRAADEEVKRRAEADAKRQIEASRVAAANEVAAAPVRVFSFVVFSPTVCPYIHTEPVFINLTHNSQGFPAAFNAAAVAAIASGDASKVHVILRIVRAPGRRRSLGRYPGVRRRGPIPRFGLAWTVFIIHDWWIHVWATRQTIFLIQVTVLRI